MKVKIETEKRYKITINGVVHEGFKKLESWEGMTKYRNDDGVIITGSPSPLPGVVREMLGHGGVEEVEVVSMSPDLWAKAGR